MFLAVTQEQRPPVSRPIHAGPGQPEQFQRAEFAAVRGLRVGLWCGIVWLSGRAACRKVAKKEAPEGMRLRSKASCIFIRLCQTEPVSPED